MGTNRETGKREPGEMSDFLTESLYRTHPDIVATGIQRILLERIFPLLEQPVLTDSQTWEFDIYTALAHTAHELSKDAQTYRRKLLQLLSYLRFVGYTPETLSRLSITTAEERSQEEYNQPTPIPFPRSFSEGQTQVVKREFEEDFETRQTLRELDVLMKQRETLPSYEEYLVLLEEDSANEES